MKKLGYVKATVTAGVAVLALAGQATAYSGENFVTCDLDPNGDNFLALRECGSGSCAMLRKLPPDTFLLTVEPVAENGWREVIVLRGLQDQGANGQWGWVYGQYICEIIYPNRQ